MRIPLLTVLAISASPEQTPDDAKKLEGAWVMVSGEHEGKALLMEYVKNARLVIKGNEHAVKVGGNVIKGTHKVNPTKKPKEINSAEIKGAEQGQDDTGDLRRERGPVQGLFCAAGEGPAEFTTKSGTGQILHVWKRQKP